MARGINKVILIGNLGHDPELRQMPSGSAVLNIRIATSEGWKDKNSGEMRERTEWHNIVLFNRLAETAGKYLKKGSRIYVEGSLRTRKWQGKDGNDRYSTEVVARDMQMLGGRGESGSNFSEGNSYGNSDYGNENFGSAGGSQQNASAASDSAMEDNGGFGDDDIPF